MTDTFSGWTFGNADEGDLGLYRVLRGGSTARFVIGELHLDDGWVKTGRQVQFARKLYPAIAIDKRPERA